MFFILANHPCRNSNGYCTHLCLIKPNGYQCACPDEDDGRECSTTPAPPPTTPTQPLTTTPVDYCALQPCQNEAKCKGTDNDYMCHCVGYYYGKNCSIELGKLNELSFCIKSSSSRLIDYNVPKLWCTRIIKFSLLCIIKRSHCLYRNSIEQSECSFLSCPYLSFLLFNSRTVLPF